MGQDWAMECTKGLSSWCTLARFQVPGQGGWVHGYLNVHRPSRPLHAYGEGLVSVLSVPT